MSQNLIPVLLFVVFLALVPLGLKWVRRQQLGHSASTFESKIVSAVAVGPQQRVVSVEVGPRDARVLLTLGVTSQSIHVLHSVPLTKDPVPAAEGSADLVRTQP
jgi:flagellar protein FliO/FliZ